MAVEDGRWLEAGGWRLEPWTLDMKHRGKKYEECRVNRAPRPYLRAGAGPTKLHSYGTHYTARHTIKP